MYNSFQSKQEVTEDIETSAITTVIESEYEPIEITTKHIVTPHYQAVEPTPTTYYDKLTDNEINMIEVTVQHEVGNLSYQYKRLITELIYNRLMSEDYPNDVQEMLFQEEQFTGINNWYHPEFPVDDETKRIVKDVLSKETTPHNATAYYNPELSDPNAVEWFESSEYMVYLFSHSEESYGITYTTRFFATDIPSNND